MTAPKTDIEELHGLLRGLNRVLVLVAVLALIFTCVSVTLFAIRHGISPYIAWLLDPMVSIVLATVLVVDGRLSKFAEHATRPSGSAAVLRWFAGLATWSMNAWSSLWPGGSFGVPRHMDVAGFWLHSIPPILLILMAEAATVYRRVITRIIAKRSDATRTATASRPATASQPATRTAASPRQAAASPAPATAASPASASPQQTLPAPTEAASATPASPPATGPASTPTGSQPKTTTAATDTPAGNSEARDLDEVAAVFRKLQAELGKSPSDAALARELGVGRSRAQQLRTAAIEAGHADLAKPVRAA